MGKSYPWLYRMLLAWVVVLAAVPTAVHAQPTPLMQTPALNLPIQVDTRLTTPQQLPPSPHTPVQVSATNGAVSIRWPDATVSAAAALSRLPTTRYQGYELPMQLVTVVLPAGTDIAAAGASASSASSGLVQINTLMAEQWHGELQTAAPLQPPVLDMQSYTDAPLDPEVVALPSAPLFLLRQGNLHGQAVAVFALSPIYRDGDSIKIATDLAATIKGASPFAESALSITSAQAATAGAATGARDNVHRSPLLTLQPSNPNAARQAIKLTITEAGLQAVTGAQLADAGFSLTTLNPALLQLNYNGAEVALEVEGIVNGQLTAASILRFYVPTVGDRWNTTAIYWLTNGETAGVRMASRTVAPTTAPTRNSAMAQGRWESPKIYDSRYAGADQDHWFHQKLIVSQNNSAALETVTIDVAPQLPRIDGTATYTVAVTTNLRGEHTLRLLVNNQSTDITWDSTVNGTFFPDWQPSFTSTLKSSTLGVALRSVVAANAQSDPTVWLDKLFWEQPVQLAFQQKGAYFTGVTGTWHYNWSGLPTGYRFYDITTPTTPLLLTGATVTGFQDGPTAHHYLLADPDTVHTPTVARHDPVQFDTNGADAIYIAPAVFLDTLDPLLQLRRDQGYEVVRLDVQDIYDAWSYGHVSPTAIRTFLRYAHSTWSPTPYSVVLVGDGTWDPHDYEEKRNTNFIPPYLAHVDPWLGEAACENCFIQLDGDDPLTGDGPAGQFFSIDMWIGRLPVKSVGELINVIEKIIRYETMTTAHLWQNRVVFVADNYIRTITDSGEKVVDLAGDFAKHSDNIALLAPAAVKNERVYYDPHPQLADPNGQQPWRITDAMQAFKAVLTQLSAGAGVVVYNGHSHQWQWAVTDESSTANLNYLFGLYDADGLTNNESYFINLAMTCLTSQFHKPAVSGTVLDERLLLNPNGGAIAVWGPAGLSVAYGHDFLQRGFFEKLWRSPRGTAPLGALLEAGYTKLLLEESCCQDTAKTFLLLGDPLTKAQVSPDEIHGIYLPTINREDGIHIALNRRSGDGFVIMHKRKAGACAGLSFMHTPMAP